MLVQNCDLVSPRSMEEFTWQEADEWFGRPLLYESGGMADLYDEASQASTTVADDSQSQESLQGPGGTMGASGAEDSIGRPLKMQWKGDCKARLVHCLAVTRLKDAVRRAGQQSDRIELQAGQTPMDTLWAMVAVYYNDYGVSSERWHQQPKNTFNYAETLMLDPSAKDQVRSEDELKRYWRELRRACGNILEPYFRSGQNADLSWKEPLSFYSFSGKSKGNGSYGKADSAVFYAFLMIISHPHLVHFACDTLPESARFSGSIAFEGNFRIADAVTVLETVPVAASSAGTLAFVAPAARCAPTSEPAAASGRGRGKEKAQAASTSKKASATQSGSENSVGSSSFPAASRFLDAGSDKWCPCSVCQLLHRCSLSCLRRHDVCAHLGC